MPAGRAPTGSATAGESYTADLMPGASTCWPVGVEPVEEVAGDPIGDHRDGRGRSALMVMRSQGRIGKARSPVTIRSEARGDGQRRRSRESRTPEGVEVVAGLTHLGRLRRAGRNRQPSVRGTQEDVHDGDRYLDGRPRARRSRDRPWSGRPRRRRRTRRCSPQTVSARRSPLVSTPSQTQAAVKVPGFPTVISCFEADR